MKDERWFPRLKTDAEMRRPPRIPKKPKKEIFRIAKREETYECPHCGKVSVK